MDKETLTFCPCGKIIDVGPVCPSCAPAYRAGMMRSAEIAQNMGTKHGWNYHAPTMCGEVAYAIRKEAEK